MSDKLQLSLPERTKQLLQIEGEHSLFELNILLRQFRNDTHPDKFQDRDLKEKAEDRFKEAQSLLDECAKQMEVERFNHKHNELTLYKPFYDALELQNELDSAKTELTATKRELEDSQRKIQELTNELQSNKDNSLNLEIQHLQTLYCPSSRNYASIGTGIVLSGALGVMSQMEKVSSILENHSPFGKEYISTSLFICMLLFLAVLCRKIWEREYVNRKAEDVCSPIYTERFIEYLKITRSSDSEVNTFSEVEVFNYLSGKNSTLKLFAKLLSFQIFSPKTVNRLKDIFIHSLLNKKLIDFSKAENMQRKFKITNSSDMSDFWHRQYMNERKKNKDHEHAE